MSNAGATVSTFAGQLAEGFLNGNGTAALFSHPMGLATDADGNVYVADSFNSAIRKIATDGTVTTVAGTGAIGLVNGSAATAKFYAPSGLVLDATGNIYVADRGNNVIRKITPAGEVTTLAGNGIAGYANGTGAAATFNTPTGIAIDATGNLFVTDYGNNIIRKVTPAGVVTTIAGSRTAAYVEGTSTKASFNKPTGIALDATGNIYVTEALSHSIRVINADTLVTNFNGSTLGNSKVTSWLGSPNAIAIDASGNFWITDAAGRILKIDADRKFTVQAGVSGTTGSANGVGAAALFNNPTGIAVSKSGSVYVADYDNNLIRKLN
ncbi:hypothetical protein BC343_18845 [Mucilaginibacter pedocola]|uniref:SMP-30/Gluconolactonase/LRE-like region domain-containing protein n=2 Tax=Mucilaginibacter pedocola TaxID=1792845 RepID=A0A1S9P757_9SPHI|nr:hypothetical protein BC343_18845 [Mucilaginibacter pedocola]